VTDEQPLGGGAAFWAARGVRIEPEVVGGDLPDEAAEADVVETADEAEAGAEAEADDGPEAEAVAEVESVVDVEPIVEVEQSTEAEEPVSALDETAAEPTDETTTEPTDEPADETAAEPSPDEKRLPGFPQQRGSEASPVDAAPVAAVPSPAAAPAEPTEPTEAPEDDPLAEPAWQLTGTELAAPLPPLKTCIEAILMVVDEPTSVVTLAQVLERPKSEVAEALTELAEEYTVQRRGFELREVGLGADGEHTGWRVYSRPECAPVVERFVRDGQQAKLTQAALETLAVVAYRQPVSRSKVSAIRGVNCDGVMRTLLARGLVEEYGNDLETGAVLYQTTGFFLERMGLKSLDELPELAPLLPSAADVDIEDFA
jgi:segregation and condensation protein B